MKKIDSLQTGVPETVTISRAEYEKLQAQSKRVSELESRVDMLVEARRLAQHKRFGASSEKSEDALYEQLSFLFSEAEVFTEMNNGEENVTVVAAHKRHEKHEYTLDKMPENVPVERNEHRLEAEALACPECGGELAEIGKEVVNKLKIIPTQVVVEQHIYYSYACRRCSRESIETPVARAPRMKAFLPGSFATPEAVAYIMTQKFVMGVPIYRQEQELNRRGIQSSRQTMSNWNLRAAEDLLKPVYDQLHRELNTREVLSMQMKQHFRFFKGPERHLRATVICGFTVPAEIRKSPLYCMNTSQGVVESIQRISRMGSTGISIRKAMPGIAIFRRRSP